MRPRSATGTVVAIGKGNGCVVAFYAAALEPRISKVTCEHMPPSYLQIARSKMHEDAIDIVVPGVLRDFDLPDVVLAVNGR